MNNNKGKSEKRLFLAIDIPEFIKNDIYKFTSGLLSLDRRIRVLPALNIHITLKFLGSVNAGKIKKIEEASILAAGKFNRFKYKFNGKIGAFPSLEKAGVIFLGIGMGADNISEVYNELEGSLARIKVKREKRKFFPHLTVARTRITKDVSKLIDNHKFDYDNALECSEISLFESKLKSYGAEYINLNNFSLK